MIYLRDDDVLVSSSSSQGLKRFKQIHNWVAEVPGILHIPTILVTEIQQFPEGIEFVREETAKGKMRPELHGLEHIDYNKLSRREVREHLLKSREFIESEFDYSPSLWAPPWGADSDFLKEIAEEQGFQLQNCTTDVVSLENATAALRVGRVTVAQLSGQYIFMHYWQRGLRVKRLAEAVRYNSWEAAADLNPEIF